MNPYIIQLDLSLPETERLIRKSIFERDICLTQRFPHWKKSKIALRDDPSVESENNKALLAQEDLGWLGKINQSVTAAYGPKPLVFDQFDVLEPYRQQILDSLPESIKKFSVNMTAQIAKGGDYIQPHRDHNRKCGLFFSVSAPDCETVWYSKKDNFREFSTLRFAFPEDLKVECRTIIQKGKWYLFNNEPFHSVHRLPGKLANRISFVIDFRDLGYQEVIDCGLLDGIRIID